MAALITVVGGGLRLTDTQRARVALALVRVDGFSAAEARAYLDVAGDLSRDWLRVKMLERRN